MLLSYLLVLELGVHLAEAVCLLGLISGGVGQELEHPVVATVVLLVGSPGTLQALGPAGQSGSGLCIAGGGLRLHFFKEGGKKQI